MNTKPPVNPSIRSVWTNDKQAQLDALISERKRIYSKAAEPLNDLVLESGLTPDIVTFIIQNAQLIRDLLIPFDGRR